MLKVFQTVCILVASVLSCQAKNCCYPVQFEATNKHASITVDKTGRSSFVTMNSALSFDTLGKRIYVNSVVNTDNGTERTVKLELYEKGVQYTVSNNKSCSKARLEPWANRNCIPDNAVKLPRSTLGMKPNLMVQDYTWKLRDIMVTMTVTSNTCVPVFHQYYGSFPGGIVFASRLRSALAEWLARRTCNPRIAFQCVSSNPVSGHLLLPRAGNFILIAQDWLVPGKQMGVSKVEDVTTGIKNPCVFEVPDICKHVQLEDIATRRPMCPF